MGVTMNVSRFIALYDAGKPVYKLWNEIQYSGKEYMDEVVIKDSSGRHWEVKVRCNREQKRHLKIQSKSMHTLQIVAAADFLKQNDSLRITADEWHVFFLLANYKHDGELYAFAHQIINKLVK